MRRSAIALAALLITACGGDEPSDAATPDLLHLGRPATLAQLTGPWRPEPLSVDQALEARVARVCLAEISEGKVPR